MKSSSSRTRWFAGLAIALTAIAGTFRLITASAPQVPSNTWAPAGDMADARAGASATLLTGGRVLIAGGRTDAGVTASAERYSPAREDSWRRRRCRMPRQPFSDAATRRPRPGCGWHRFGRSRTQLGGALRSGRERLVSCGALVGRAVRAYRNPSCGRPSSRCRRRRQWRRTFHAGGIRPGGRDLQPARCDIDGGAQRTCRRADRRQGPYCRRVGRLPGACVS